MFNNLLKVNYIFNYYYYENYLKTKNCIELNN